MKVFILLLCVFRYRWYVPFTYKIDTDLGNGEEPRMLWLNLENSRKQQKKLTFLK